MTQIGDGESEAENENVSASVTLTVTPNGMTIDRVDEAQETDCGVFAVAVT